MSEATAILLLVAAWLAFDGGETIGGAVLCALATAVLVGGWIARDRRA